MTTDLEPATPKPLDYPVRMRAIEDLRRSRLTVFFRFLLTLPHLIWLALWTVGVVIVAVIAWFVVLIKGQMPAGLHRFFTMYIRYAMHVYAYLNLAANPFPGFLGENGYEIDLEFDPPARENRWKTGFRFFLAFPALVMAGVLGGNSLESIQSYGFPGSGILFVCGFGTWWYAMFKGSAPEGLMRLQWYCLHYGAQASAYLLLLTDRYPTTDPERVGVPWPAPDHPVKLLATPDDGRRSRLTVFFRLLLALPHLVWLTLWAILVELLAIVNWIVTLIRGRSPASFHRFFSAFSRYAVHVLAYVTLVANPFPGFTGAAGSYPVDLEIAGPQQQNRWRTGFRLFLVLPAAVLAGVIGYALWAVAFLGWFASLATGRMPDGFRKLGLFALRYNAQANAYGYLLLTERYPYSGPPA